MQKTANLEALELLLQLKKDENIPIQQIVDEDGNTLLHKAIMFVQVDVVRYLIHHHPILCNCKNNFNAYAIHLAVVKCDMSILRLISKHSRKIVNKRDLYGYTPAMYASVSGQYETLKYLLDYSNAKYNKLTKKGKLNLLHLGVQSGNLDVVQYLLMKMGIGYLKNRTADGATVFHLAAARGHDEILKYLLALKASKYVKNYKDITGSTCFHDAAENGHPKCLKLLFDSGMDVFEPDYESITPYQLAITSKNEECVNFAKNIKLLVSENSFLKENVKVITTNEFDAANIVSQNSNLKKIALKRLGSMLRLRRAKDVNQDQAYLYTQRFRPAPVSLPQSSKIGSIQSNPPLLHSENEDDLCDSAIEELINHVHTNLLRSKQDGSLTMNCKIREDVDMNKRKFIANTSNHVKYARKMDRERIETSLGLILKNSLSATKLSQPSQSSSTSSFVKNYVTTNRLNMELKNQNLNRDNGFTKNKEKKNESIYVNMSNNNNIEKKDNKSVDENYENSEQKPTNTARSSTDLDKPRRSNSHNHNFKKYSSERISDPSRHLANLENKLKRYSFSYLCNANGSRDASQPNPNDRFFRSFSLNRNNNNHLFNAEHVKILLKYNNENNKHIDADLLNEYLFFNKYLSENNLLSKCEPYLENENEFENCDEYIQNNNRNKSIENNILFEHVVNLNGCSSSRNNDEDADFDEDELEDVITTYTNGKFSKSIPNISNIRTKKNLLEASIMPFYETKLINNNNNNTMSNGNINSNNTNDNNYDRSSNMCLLRESFRIQNNPINDRTSRNSSITQNKGTVHHHAKQSQTNISISSNNLAASISLELEKKSVSQMKDDVQQEDKIKNSYISLDCANANSNNFFNNNMNSNLDEKKEYYNENKAEGFLNDENKNELVNSQTNTSIPPPPPQLSNLLDTPQVLTSTLSKTTSNQKLSISNSSTSNTNSLNANKAFISIDSESLLNAKQNLKSVKSTPQTSSSSSTSNDEMQAMTSNDEKDSVDAGSFQPPVPNGIFLTNTTNSKKNDRLLNEIKSHRLYNIKKDYVLDYLDRNQNNNQTSSNTNTIQNNKEVNKPEEIPKLSSIESNDSSISRSTFSKNNNTFNKNSNNNNKIFLIKSNENRINQEKSISISASSSSSSSLSISSSSSSSHSSTSSSLSSTENGLTIKRGIQDNSLSISNSNINTNKFNSITKIDKTTFNFSTQHKKNVLNNQNDLKNAFRSYRGLNGDSSKTFSPSTSDNQHGEVILGIELIEANNERSSAKTNFISEKINYFRNKNNAVVGRNVSCEEVRKKESNEIMNTDNNAVKKNATSRMGKKVIPEEKYESELDMVFKKRAALLLNLN